MQIPAMPVRPIHHGGYDESMYLIFLHFIAFFKALKRVQIRLLCALLRLNSPPDCTRKWPPLRSFHPAPGTPKCGARENTPARRSCAAATPRRGHAKSSTGSIVVNLYYAMPRRPRLSLAWAMTWLQPSICSMSQVIIPLNG